MPVLPLLIGCALLVICLALLSLLRFERIHGPAPSLAKRWSYRLVTVLVVLFAGYWAVGLIVIALMYPGV